MSSQYKIKNSYVPLIVSLCLLAVLNKINNLQSAQTVTIFRRMIHRHPQPVFPNNYHSTGLLRLPHGNIKEPFEIWFSGKDRRSRVDFYYGKLRHGVYSRGEFSYCTTWHRIPYGFLFSVFRFLFFQPHFPFLTHTFTLTFHLTFTLVLYFYFSLILFLLCLYFVHLLIYEKLELNCWSNMANT